MNLIPYQATIYNCNFQTKANDLKTELALGIKREMIKALHAGCPAWNDDPDMQKDVLEKFKQYGDQVG